LHNSATRLIELLPPLAPVSNKGWNHRSIKTIFPNPYPKKETFMNNEYIETRADFNVEHDITMEIIRRLENIVTFPYNNKSDIEINESEFNERVVEFIDVYEIIRKHVCGKVRITKVK
jgi:hypothetical protein